VGVSGLGRFARGQPRGSDPRAIAIYPLWLTLAPQPLGGDDGQSVEGMAQGLADTLQAIKGTDSSQHVSRVGALTAPGFEQLALPAALEQRIEQELFRMAVDQACPELAEHGGVEAWIRQLQIQSVLPVDTAAHGVRRLPIREPFGVLHDGHQCQSPRNFGWLPASGEQGGKGNVLIDGAEFVPHVHIEVALGECGARHASGLRGDGGKGLGMQRHNDPPCPLSEQKFLPSTRGCLAAALHHEFASGITFGDMPLRDFVLFVVILRIVTDPLGTDRLSVSRSPEFP